MALRIGGIPVLLGPSDVAGGIRAVLGWTDEAVELVGELPGRVERLLTDVEALLVRIDRVASNAETVTAAAARVVDHTTATVERAEATLTGTSDLLDLYRPIAEKAAPMARQFVEEFSAEELHAAIRMVDAIPRLTAHIEDDVLPLLTTLDHVGPDLRELITLVTDVRNALASMPGIRLLMPKRD